MSSSADVVICGAGIAGIAAAYHLAVRGRAGRVCLIDEREPLTLTSDKGTQGYRNWWPGPDNTMLRFVSRSIDLLEELADESANAFRLSRRGYVFVTGREEGVERMRTTAREVSRHGMGPIREHPGQQPYVPAPPEGFRDHPVGADLLLDAEAQRAFPYLTRDVVAALHIRRAGWLNAVALGSWLLKRATGAGVAVVRDRMTSVRTEGGAVRGVRLASGAVIDTRALVIAAGPLLGETARLLGLELPVLHELHAKMAFRDPLHTVPRNAPFLIWNDPVELPWSGAERATFSASDDTRSLLEPFPGGVHLRPFDGPHGDELYLIWTFDAAPRPFAWPPRFDPRHGEVLLRGVARMVPAFTEYFGLASEGFVDGGFYCKTPENRPLIGPLPIEGAFVIGALSGYGVMASQAAAELLAAHVLQTPLPDYSPAFLPSRYEDPAYEAMIERWGALAGQL